MSEEKTPHAARGTGDGTANGSVFINYRRDDTKGSAGRLFDRLEAERKRAQEAEAARKLAEQETERKRVEESMVVIPGGTV